MAEIGVLRGRLADLVLAGRPSLGFVMVDNWRSSEDQPEQYKATQDEHAFADKVRAAKHEAEARAVAARYGSRVKVLAQDSTEAARSIRDRSLDLVFLDGDHSEPGVAADLAAWTIKVKIGGWIGGHDYGNADPRYDFSGVARAVDRVFPGRELDLNFTWWQRIGGGNA